MLNPLRTHRFAGEDLARTKTDARDALCLARFAQQKRPAAARLPDKALEGLRELVRLRDGFMQHIKTLDSDLATSILAKYPTAKAFQQLKVRQLASLRLRRTALLRQGAGYHAHRGGQNLCRCSPRGALSAPGAFRL